MNIKKILLIVLLCLIFPALTSSGTVHAWYWDEVSLTSTLMPFNYSTDTGQLFSQASTGQDCFDLKEGHVRIYRCEEDAIEFAWNSPDNWQVIEVAVSDLNRDGDQELALLVWRPFEPWPIDRFLPQGGRIANFHGENGRSCHLILVGWDGERYRELWAGSAMADPISHIAARDIDGDGYDELLAIESRYDHHEVGNLVIWKWQGFGFTLQDRVNGEFSHFHLVKASDHLVVVSE